MTATPVSTPGGHPIGRVAAALAAGPGSVAELAHTCGLSVAEAQTALAALESIGRARRVPLLVTGCAPAGCSGCAVRSGCAAAPPAPVAALHTWQSLPGLVGRG